MLTLKLPLPEEEMWNNETEMFMQPGELGIFHFEHSLKSVSDWESKHRIPFLTREKKTLEQYLDYYKMMCLEDIPYEYLTMPVMNKINEYINLDASATTVKSKDSGASKLVTSEVIYGYMCEAGIPFEAETWHLSRLMKLIQVISDIRNPGKKMSKAEIYEQNRRLNEERRRKYNTKG